ncbi:hypothetical protein M0R45_000526 [Rubus argutus]|uniref:Uncharacterized protein n=1 Tax=Rubus argutus TaxID=59490 RepID=A0AAW1VP65_RUBAR
MVMERSDGSGSAHGSRRERGAGGALGFVMARRRRGLAWLVLSVINCGRKDEVQKPPPVLISLSISPRHLRRARITLSAVVLTICHKAAATHRDATASSRRAQLQSVISMSCPVLNRVGDLTFCPHRLLSSTQPPTPSLPPPCLCPRALLASTLPSTPFYSFESSPRARAHIGLITVVKSAAKPNAQPPNPPAPSP